MKKEHINLLECQVLEEYLQDNAAYHEGQIVPYYGDNSVAISCVRKGRSNSKKLNAMVQRILLMCYQYDLYLELTLIPSKVNVLADAASRQQWHVYDAHWPTFDLFAEYRRHQKWGASKSSDKLQVLHPRARQAVHDTKKDAFEPSTISNAKSAWVLWEAYMQDNNRDAYLDLNDPHFDVYIAGYEACLTQGLYGKLRSSDSILTYKSQILWCLNQHNQSRLKQDVERGMQKQLRFNKRPVDPWRLEYFASLYERHAHSKNLHQLQTLLALSFLGFGIQRSRSAVTKIASVFETDKNLCVSDVRLDRDLYAVWWGVKSSKGDPFAKRMGRDRKDWVPTAGCKAAQHPIDIVALLIRFCKEMGYSIDGRGKIYSPQGNDAPFFQQIIDGRPSGKPLTYAQLLAAMKQTQQELRQTYPDIVDAHFGLHSMRRFGATLAKTQGIPDDLIQLMGRWVSMTFQRYFVFDNADLVAINRQLLN